MQFFKNPETGVIHYLEDHVTRDDEGYFLDARGKRLKVLPNTLVPCQEPKPAGEEKLKQMKRDKMVNLSDNYRGSLAGYSLEYSGHSYSVTQQFASKLSNSLSVASLTTSDSVIVFDKDNDTVVLSISEAQALFVLVVQALDMVDSHFNSKMSEVKKANAQAVVEKIKW